jgi:hypothetical protein
MEHLAQVDLLIQNAIIDYNGWYDYFEEVAIGYAKNFSDAEWDELYQQWKTKEEEWQAKLAGMLGSYKPEKTIPLLEEMAINGSPLVASEALNSLEGMDGDEYLYIPATAMLTHLEKMHAVVQNPIHKDTIESLQNRAGKP